MTKKERDAYFVWQDGVQYRRHDGAAYGTCPDCVIGLDGCSACGGFGLIWTNDPRSFPLHKLEELRLQDLSEEDDYGFTEAAGG